MTERFETPPGQQAHFDWSPYTVELGGEPTRVVVFGMVLGDRRRTHYTASLDETQGSIDEAIESCRAQPARPASGGDMEPGRWPRGALDSRCGV